MGCEMRDKMIYDMIDEMRELTMDNYAVNCFQANMADFDDEQILEFLERCSSLGKF